MTLIGKEFSYIQQSWGSEANHVSQSYQQFPKELANRVRSQDGGGIGRVITFSSTNSLKEQQNGEQSL